MTTTDKLKLWLAAALVVGGVYVGFYHLDTRTAALRFAVFAGGLAAALLVGYFSAPGRGFLRFCREAFAELRKVVWPARQETLRLTAVVIAFAAAVALFLWMVDGVLLWLFSLIAL
jgi:preprotein translocase subunit SecE